MGLLKSGSKRAKAGSQFRARKREKAYDCKKGMKTERMSKGCESAKEIEKDNILLLLNTLR